MKIVMFYQSLISDWNNGNAHFLRGIISELKSRGHDVKLYEQDGNTCIQNLVLEHGQKAVKEFYSFYPDLSTNFYNPLKLNLDNILKEADLVIAHEANDPEMIARIGEVKSKHKFKVLFHVTNHRVVTDKEAIEKYNLGNVDGVLAFGDVIKNIFLIEGWAKRAWAWHEAADTRMFYPRSKSYEGDLVWIGNYDEERSVELQEFLINPVKELKLKAKVYGVRFPESVIKAFKEAGIEYGGWLPNFKVPDVFAKYRVTVHIPRRPYVQLLPGIPTIRPFEALACGIPLISAPWSDCENLFSPGKDYLVARTGKQMVLHLAAVLNTSINEALSISGLRAINKKHTCFHRVNELEKICEEIGIDRSRISSSRQEIYVAK
ncbi:MAG: glycosyltransferase [Sporocytophaga sp.]|uniref:CgeB family protein n=1 Tax=Sporocytophaga sp. TaxID=2231183 RepID=UPI001B24DDAE|nr:glycosyltransferase [Sporocytophaga sp.]MBO9703796.1 glycosyltransferase [Sporocytophaga sp.]